MSEQDLKSVTEPKPEQVNANPAKRFFVEMLTRDIELKDSILDLLDNCIDGVMREKKGSLDQTLPYEGYHAHITFDADHFEISDNCGGIPKEVALNRAFRLGRPNRDIDRDLPTVGVYGIGMKRAIFKMGQLSEVRSTASDSRYMVKITPEWLEDDFNWTLPITELKQDTSVRGTKVTIRSLHPGISRLFSDETAFENDLIKSISAYYGNIIRKGFEVKVNDKPVSAQLASFIINNKSLESGEGLAPYIYTGEFNGVSIQVAIGLYRNLPSDEEQEEQLQGRPSTETAGWTIICNDRVVLYADKTKVTGWGEAGVPQYHTQFVSISGVVNFKSNDASLLPVTTTKRGIDGNSDLYLSVKEFMREGMKLFTDYTNKWKGSTTRPEMNQTAQQATPSSLASQVSSNLWTQDRKSIIKGSKFKPQLPLPERDKEQRFLRFSKPLSDIRFLGEHFFDNPDASPGDIGGACFDQVLAEIKE